MRLSARFLLKSNRNRAETAINAPKVALREPFQTPLLPLTVAGCSAQSGKRRRDPIFSLLASAGQVAAVISLLPVGQ